MSIYPVQFALVRLSNRRENKRVNSYRTHNEATTRHLEPLPFQLDAMLDVEDFDAVFQGLNYTNGLVQQIQEYQHALGGQTFFERLLDLLKIKGKYGNHIADEEPSINRKQGAKRTHPRRRNNFMIFTSASYPPKPHYTTSIA
jgi:hypothetical protein